MTKRPTKTFGDVMPKIEFHPELPKITMDEVLNKEFEVTEAKIVREFDSQFGKSDFVLLLLTDPDDGAQATTLCGGMVVVKKLQYAIENNLLPLRGTITKDAAYYDIA